MGIWTWVFLTPNTICENTELGMKGMQLWGFRGDIESWIWVKTVELEGGRNMGQPAQGAGSLFFWVLALDLGSTSGGKMT